MIHGEQMQNTDSAEFGVGDSNPIGSIWDPSISCSAGDAGPRYPWDQGSCFETGDSKAINSIWDPTVSKPAGDARYSELARDCFEASDSIIGTPDSIGSFWDSSGSGIAGDAGTTVMSIGFRIMAANLSSW